MTTLTKPPELAAGMLIAQRFRLERKLGQGGMGSVWAAQHLALNVEVAVKFIDGAFGSNQEVLSRFAQEAMAAAKINSPHVVKIMDYGSDEYARPYIAMEILEGQELAARLEREPQLPLGEVHRIVSQACRGLTRAHAAGVVHRDIKPENIFLCDDDDGFLVKVLDFGIAKADSPIGATSHRTGTGQLLGTPIYMSPEQALGNSRVDFRSDLYSLAVVAFRCLAGSPPFDSEGLGELIVRISTFETPSVRASRPELPAGVDEFFRKAMQKDPAKRFGSARELADAFSLACNFTVLQGVAGAHPLVPSVDPKAPLEVRSSQVTLGDASERPPVGTKNATLFGASTTQGAGKGAARRGRVVAVLVGVVAIAAGAAAYETLRSRPANEQTTEARSTTADPGQGSSAAGPGQRPAGAPKIEPVPPTTDEASATATSASAGKPAGGDGRSASPAGNDDGSKKGAKAGKPAPGGKGVGGKAPAGAAGAPAQPTPTNYGI